MLSPLFDRFELTPAGPAGALAASLARDGQMHGNRGYGNLHPSAPQAHRGRWDRRACGSRPARPPKRKGERMRRRSSVWAATALLVAIITSGCSNRRTSGLAASTASPSPPAIDWGAVDQAMGRPAGVLDGGVHRYGLPRTDLTVHLGDVVL